MYSTGVWSHSVSSITACSSRWRRACQSPCPFPSSSSSSPSSAHRPFQPQPPFLPSSGSISPPSSRAMPILHLLRTLLSATTRLGLHFRPIALLLISCTVSRNIIIFGGESQGGFAQGQTYMCVTSLSIHAQCNLITVQAQS